MISTIFLFSPFALCQETEISVNLVEAKSLVLTYDYSSGIDVRIRIDLVAAQKSVSDKMVENSLRLIADSLCQQQGEYIINDKMHSFHAVSDDFNISEIFINGFSFIHKANCKSQSMVVKTKGLSAIDLSIMLSCFSISAQSLSIIIIIRTDNYISSNGIVKKSVSHGITEITWPHDLLSKFNLKLATKR